MSNRTSNLLRAALAAALVGLVSVPASAENQSFEPKRVIETITERDLFAALRDIDANVYRLDDGEVRYTVTFDDGGKAVIKRAACQDKDCYGLLLLAFFTPPDGVGQQVADERVRRFNIEYSPASALRTDSGDYVLKNYVIADEGITMGNLSRSLALFQEMIGTFANELYDD